jgi:hypothetical protein
MTPLEYIQIRAPQYATDPRIDGLIGIADEYTGTEFGARYKNAVALRVMHWKAREEMRGGAVDGSTSGTGEAGTIRSESEGELSRSYNEGAGSNKYGDLATTVYGQELIELMNSCLMLPRTRAMDV